MQSEPAFLKNCMNSFKSRKASHATYWSKQHALEVSVIATEMVSSTILFPTKKAKKDINQNVRHQYFVMFSCQWGGFDVFINFKQISHFVLEFILLALDR